MKLQMFTALCEEINSLYSTFILHTVGKVATYLVDMFQLKTEVYVSFEDNPFCLAPMFHGIDWLQSLNIFIIHFTRNQ